jgi:small subunit ribosomal protein S6
MRRYETICILRPTLSEEQISTLIDNTTNIITSDNGQIIELDKWGMKKLSYLIKKESLGYYIYYDFAGSPEAVAEMERKFRIDDSVLRYLTVKTSEAITAEEVAKETAELADRKAAAALASEENENQEEEMSENTDDDDSTDDED